MKAIQVSAPGDADALQYVDVPMPVAKENEVLVRVEAIGVNYIDVYHRTGLYKLPLPFIPGSEAAGVIEETSERVAWAFLSGTYAEYAAVPREKLVPLPPDVDVRTAAASMLQGMTAHYLVTSTYPLAAGSTALVHAAAGGVGGILVQMAKQRGARVFATASTSKLDIVRELGADVVIDYTIDDFAEVIFRETEQRGVDVVYDSVGRTTFDRSLDVLATRGMLVLFGQSSGVVPPIDPTRFAKKSTFFSRPTLGAYTVTRDELLWRSRDLFESIRSGEVRIRIDRELPLRDAAQAHRLLESRATTGKLVLVP
ncbi:MAG TPA: quinone oxidoreductase [Thermoanaerobaculia bacterium]|nr:quinone oxidoreductase [Thermoanaerobaculia bacterium]